MRVILNKEGCSSGYLSSLATNGFGWGSWQGNPDFANVRVRAVMCTGGSKTLMDEFTSLRCALQDALANNDGADPGVTT